MLVLAALQGVVVRNLTPQNRLRTLMLMAIPDYQPKVPSLLRFGARIIKKARACRGIGFALAMFCFVQIAYSQGNPAPLYLFTSGNGSITPYQSGQMLEAGQTYEIAATPAEGYQFTSWQPANVFVITQTNFSSEGVPILPPVMSIVPSVPPTNIYGDTLEFTLQDGTLITSPGENPAIFRTLGWQADFVPVLEPAVTATVKLSVNGIAEFVDKSSFQSDKMGTNIVDTNDVTVPMSKSFNNKYIYNIISNAVANAGSYSTNLASTNLPPDGYVGFNPTGSDGEVEGFFYVTNKSGFYLPLSGLDATNGYYSWIELDTKAPISAIGGYNYTDIGFGSNFNETYHSTYGQKSGNGDVSVTATALLFIHDNPYVFDDADDPQQYNSQNTGIEIRGIMKINQVYKKGVMTQWTATLSGTGNIFTSTDGNGEVTSAKATFTK